MSTRRVTFFHRLLSYITHLRIERVQSEWNDTLEMILADGRYMLNTSGATYSFEDKYTSFRKALQHTESDIRQYKTALVLGLGLGSVPYMLQKQFGFNQVIDCVEIDPAVIALAEKYYANPAGWSNLHITCADAVDWIQANQKQYDLIIADVFIDTKVPVSLHSRTFLTQLRKAVAPGGTLLFSRLQSRQRFERDLWNNLQTVFPEAAAIDTGGNVILHFKAKQADAHRNGYQ